MFRTFYELVTSYYRGGKVTSRIYAFDDTSKPKDQRKILPEVTIVREYFYNEEDAKKFQAIYLQ